MTDIKSDFRPFDPDTASWQEKIRFVFRIQADIQIEEIYKTASEPGNEQLRSTIKGWMDEAKQAMPPGQLKRLKDTDLEEQIKNRQKRKWANQMADKTLEANPAPPADPQIKQRFERELREAIEISQDPKVRDMKIKDIQKLRKQLLEGLPRTQAPAPDKNQNKQMAEKNEVSQNHPVATDLAMERLPTPVIKGRPAQLS